MNLIKLLALVGLAICSSSAQDFLTRELNLERIQMRGAVKSVQVGRHLHSFNHLGQKETIRDVEKVDGKFTRFRYSSSGDMLNITTTIKRKDSSSEDIIEIKYISPSIIKTITRKISGGRIAVFPVKYSHDKQIMTISLSEKVNHQPKYIEYEYDSTGRFDSYRFYVSGILKNETVWHYNSYGDPKRIESRFKGKIQSVQDIEYEYDDVGNWISKRTTKRIISGTKSSSSIHSLNRTVEYY